MSIILHPPTRTIEECVSGFGNLPKLDRCIGNAICAEMRDIASEHDLWTKQQMNRSDEFFFVDGQETIARNAQHCKMNMCAHGAHDDRVNASLMLKGIFRRKDAWRLFLHSCTHLFSPNSTWLCDVSGCINDEFFRDTRNGDYCLQFANLIMDIYEWQYDCSELWRQLRVTRWQEKGKLRAKKNGSKEKACGAISQV